jgi:hypothetical protein
LHQRSEFGLTRGLAGWCACHQDFLHRRIFLCSSSFFFQVPQVVMHCLAAHRLLVLIAGY